MAVAMKRGWRGLGLGLLFGMVACGEPGGPVEPSPPEAAVRWCDSLPRPANQAFERVRVASDWFEVYQVEPGVFALLEPKQFQEAISYLILGSERALLFDSGLGMSPIRPVVEQLTALPIIVLNSHTHYDHVGGNSEFEQVLAVDSPYTRSNQRGFSHSEVEGEVAAESFCEGPPEGLDPATFRTRPWSGSGIVKDGDRIELGGRTLEVLQVPGHTPDALALLDRDNGLLWTGDTYYDSTIWLYVPETDLEAYQDSIDRLAGLAPALRQLLPAHNTVSADPSHLADVARAIRQVRAGAIEGTEESGNRVVFRFGAFNILTSRALLDGRKGDPGSGGSGLSTWP